MSGPANAGINGDGFRFYRWEPVGGESTDVLSVTSIRNLTGEPFNLVRWKVANVIDVVLGQQKRTVIGPRGGVKSVRKVWEYPNEFDGLYHATEGEQGKMDELRKWLNLTADEPRNIAARRGTMVHAAIENNVAWDRIERPYVEASFAELSARDRAAAKSGVTDEDVDFIRNAVRRYSEMRASVPFVIIAREPQVWNLTAGYAGSADSIVWFLPEGVDIKSIKPEREITLAYVESIGGTLAVGDWKTSADVHTDHVVQVHAYGAAEFIGSEGIIDRRLTDLLQATTEGALFHIRPDKWAVDRFPFTAEIIHAFLGSCAFARLLARYPKPTPLFTSTVSSEDFEVSDPE